MRMQGGFEQFQGQVTAARRVAANKTLLDRQLSQPTGCIAGGTGDEDLRRLGYGADELKQHVLVQRGINGLTCGAVTLNLDPQTYKPGSYLIETHQGTSSWGQSRLEHSTPFLSTIPAFGRWSMRTLVNPLRSFKVQRL
jgi:hypothetical protein